MRGHLARARGFEFEGIGESLESIVVIIHINQRILRLIFFWRKPRKKTQVLSPTAITEELPENHHPADFNPSTSFIHTMSANYGKNGSSSVAVNSHNTTHHDNRIDNSVNNSINTHNETHNYTAHVTDAEKAIVLKKAVLAWYSGINFQSQQLDILQKRQPGTGDWFLNHDSFQTWVQGSDRPVLFCHGIRKFHVPFLNVMRDACVCWITGNVLMINLSYDVKLALGNLFWRKSS